MLESDRKKAAQLLINAEAERKPVLQLSKTWPDITIEDAYAIQNEVVKHKVSNGAKVIGHKIGLTSKAMQQSSQIDEPDYGHLFDYMMLNDGAKVAHASYCVPRAEVEFAFVLGKPLKGPGVDFWMCFGQRNTSFLQSRLSTRGSRTPGRFSTLSPITLPLPAS